MRCVRQTKLSGGIIFAALMFAHVGLANSSPSLSGLNMEDFSKPKKDEVDYVKNPFVQDVKSADITGLKLLGIAFREDDAAALINRQIVRKGDSVAGARVVDIFKNEVVLSTTDGIFKLTFEGRIK